MKSENNRETKKDKMKEYAEELEALKDEELDKVAAGFQTGKCGANCTYYSLTTSCICPGDKKPE